MTPLPSLFHIAFYRFIALPDADELVLRLRAMTRSLCGSVLVAGEGVNGVLAGTAEALDTFQRELREDPRFADIAFRRSSCKTAPFARIKVHKRPQIVAVGVPSGPDLPDMRVSPHAWRQLIAEDNVVVIDNRNSFEYRLGHFKNAVDPGVAHFRDFPRYVAAHAPAWKAAGTRVAMYCTGGIRCEKTSAWVRGLGLTVYELEGGILNYFQTLSDAGQDWQGECFVFDRRVALDTHLQETDTTAEQAYAGEPHNEWRLQRAKRLDAAR